jgi:hypothetical protein
MTIPNTPDGIIYWSLRVSVGACVRARECVCVRVACVRVRA